MTRRSGIKAIFAHQVLCVLLLLLSLAATAAEPVSYRLANKKGRVVIESSRGEVVPWLCYGVSSERDVEPWSRKQRGFIKAGVRLFQLSIWPKKGDYWASPFYSLDGKPVTEPREPMSLSQQAEWLLAEAPDSRFIVRFGIHPATAWRAAHQDQLQPRARKPFSSKDRYSVIPSPASELWLTGVDRLVRDVVDWCERQSWRDQIVGYSVFPYCEGSTEVAVFGEYFDRSPVMQQALRDDARRKYKTDKALQAAWNEPEITFDTIRAPTAAEWFAKRDRLKLMHWPDPTKVRRERDYFLLQKDLYHRFWHRIFGTMQEATAKRPVIKGYDILKQHMQGWLHNANFEADWRADTLDSYSPIMFASGSFGIGPLLDHPGFDTLQTPGMYYNRAMGYAWEAEGLSDSLALRGKLNFMEADMRTWVNRGWTGKPYPPGSLIKDAGVFMTPVEMAAGFDRTLAWALSRNQMFYFMSVCGANWWYDDPAVIAQIAEQREAAQTSANTGWADTTDAICLVVDDEAALYEDFSSGFQHLAVFRQLEEGLALAGVPYRIHLLSELDHPNFPDYKCYLFPNLFKIDAETEALLRRRVLRNGHLAIFGPGTGIVDDDKLSADAASRLLGVPMELVPKRTARRVMLQDYGHPMSRRLPAMTFGDSYSYGPLLAPATQRLDPATGAKPLGTAFYFYFFDRPGLFINEFGRGAAGNVRGGQRGDEDYAVVFTPAVPLPPEVLREAARYAGCNVWSEQNAVVYAAANFVALHTAKQGRHTIRLPRPMQVWDLKTKKQISRRSDRIVVEGPAPATYMFHLGPWPKTR